MSESPLISIGIGIIGIVVYYVYDAYRQSTKPSKFMLAAQEMGFIGYETPDGQRISMEQQQEALLRIFQLAGFFTLSNIWHDLNCIKLTNHLEEAFQEISAVIKYANADQADPRKFNAKYLRKNLFKSDYIDVQDALDLILYIGQRAFNRHTGQERYELRAPDWISNHADEYHQAAQLLRLIDRECPLLDEYDGVWIAGASRLGLSTRIMNFNYHRVTRNLKINGEILVLAGERELWANIDGLAPALSKSLYDASQNYADIDTVPIELSINDDHSIIDEGKSYMMHLAQTYSIKLNSSEPFIQYKNKDECPIGRFPNRLYANYDINEKSKLTETIMACDLLKTLSHNLPSKICVIDTLMHDQKRPNTVSTARDATDRFIRRFITEDDGEKKKFVILLSSNNPFIERQTLATQRQVDQMLEEFGLTEECCQIKIEGFGLSSKQPLTVVHSEFGALIAEKWKFAVARIQKSLGLKPKHDIKNLLFQTRDKNILVKDLPVIKNNPKSENFIKNWFDAYLV